MAFVKDCVDRKPIVDTVFEIVAKAKEAKAQYGEDNVVDATIGALFDEEGHIVAFESVYNNYNKISNAKKAAYADSFVGNTNYRKQVYEWVIGNRCDALNHSVIATPGGSGAISLAISQLLNAGDSLLIPDLAWGSYQLMATMNNLKSETYMLFDQDKFNIESFKKSCLNIIKHQSKLCVIINDPAHNPSGYSLSLAEWKAVISFLNMLSIDKPVILLNDIAYMDFGFDQEQVREYFKIFNDISSNLFIIVAFSCSKSLTAYGLRCGAAILLNQKAENVREVEIVFEKAARAIWSNVANAAMDNFAYVISSNRDNYINEKQQYIELLKQRSKIFLKQCDEVGLKYYPFVEGFFITVAMDSNEARDAFHEALMQQQIYVVKVNKGIRVAICSLAVNKCDHLAYKMKAILDKLN